MAETVAFKYRASIFYSHAGPSWDKWLHRRLPALYIDKDFVGRMLRVSAPILAGALALIFATNASAATCDPPCPVGELCIEVTEKLPEEQAGEKLFSICEPCRDVVFPLAEPFWSEAIRCPSGAYGFLPNCPCDHDQLVLDESLRTFTGHSGYINSIAFSPDGRHALSASLDKTLKLWDVATGKELRTFLGHSDMVSSVAFSPDGRTAISGSRDKTLKLWDVATGKELRTFKGHSKMVRSVAFSPDGHTVLSGSNDETAKLWDVATGKQLRSFPGVHQVNSVALSPDGRTALIGGPGFLKLFDVLTGKEIQTFPVSDDGWVTAAFSPDGRAALSGGQLTAFMKLWDLSTGKQIRSFPVVHQVYAVAFSPDGRTALSVSNSEYSLRLWDIATGKKLHAFKGQKSAGSVAVSPDGGTALSGGGNHGSDKDMKLWDLTTRD